MTFATNEIMGRFGRAALLALAVTATAFGQSAQVPAPPQANPILLRGATIHPVAGDVIEDGHVLFDRGVIRAVGPGAGAPDERTTVIDAGGMHVYPGLVSSATALGLTEISAVGVTVDRRELGDFTPEVRAAVAVNPDTELIPVTRANGILTALVLPDGGLVPGRGSTIRLDGWTWEDMTLDAEAGLVIEWPRTEPSTRRSSRRSSRPTTGAAEALRKLDELFDEAAAYVASRAADPEQVPDLRYEAMRDILSKRKPVFIRASSAGQIETAVGWAARRDLRAVIVGGAEADRVVDLLARHDVPVIISGTHRLPRHRHDDYDTPFTLPRKLHDAGVRFSIASGSEAAHERNLNHNAATAAAYGLPREEALRAVTQHAAEILGLGATHGTIETGKSATLIVTTGDPLEITTDTLVAFIDGRQIDLGNRHKRLYEKYREKYRQLGLLPRTESSAGR